MSTQLETLMIEIKAKIDKALSDLKKLETQVEKDTSAMTALKQAGSQAAGMLLRDMVQGATRAIGETVELGATVGSLEESFASLMGQYGEGAIALEAYKEATRGTISEVDLLKQINQGLLLGMDPSTILEMAEASVALGAAVGGDTLYAFESLTTGMGRQSKLMLDNVGIVVDLESEYNKMAEALGVSTGALTEEQRSLAFTTAAQEAMREKTALLGDSVSEATIKAQAFEAGIMDLKTGTGALIQDSALGGIAPILDDVMPMFGTFAATLIPNLIAKYGLLGMATTAWGSVTALTSSLVTTAFMGIPIIGWIAAAIAAIALLKKAWKENWFGIRDITKNVVSTIKGYVDGVINKVTKAIKKLKDLLNWRKKKKDSDEEQTTTTTTTSSYPTYPRYDEERGQFGFEGTLARDTVFKAHKGEDVLITRPGQGAARQVVIQGPLITIEGNADEATAMKAAQLVLGKIRRLI